MFMGGSCCCDGGRQRLEFLEVPLNLGTPVGNAKPRKRIVGQVAPNRKPFDPRRGEAENLGYLGYADKWFGIWSSFS